MGPKRMGPKRMGPKRMGPKRMGLALAAAVAPRWCPQAPTILT
jgi:hypothetical protein